ncbi:aspartate/glutamate racemase family protein [Enterovibrio baiacu]|uniref:aspartate/glutamate racemase family protein n=1 Tax=Enterovibrio baiacu TaxID=2491023 RepID=UPI003D1120B9
METVEKTEQTVGILGGMGPDATVDLMQRIINATPAKDDADHIRLLVDNDPKVPSRIKALIEKTGESPGPYMAKMAQGLEAAGANFLIIPCNTAHKYFDDVVNAVDVPVVNLLDIAAAHVKRTLPEATCIGLLASTAVKITDLYAPACHEQGLEVLFPEPVWQDGVMSLIRAVKANSGTSSMCSVLNIAAESLRDQGADCILIACTELSVVSNHLETSLPVFDAAQILAEHVVERVKG